MNPGFEDIFKSGRFLKISGGLVVIDNRNGKVKINPTMTLENAAKVAASYIYEAIRYREHEFDGEPIWTNSVQFWDDQYPKSPCVSITNSKIQVFRPPFLGDMEFWRAFTKYWSINVAKGMTKALIGRRKTFEETKCIEVFEKLKNTIPLGDR